MMRKMTMGSRKISLNATILRNMLLLFGHVTTVEISHWLLAYGNRLRSTINSHVNINTGLGTGVYIVHFDHRFLLLKNITTFFKSQTFCRNPFGAL